MTGAGHGTGQAIAAGPAERGTRIVPGDIDDASETSDLIGAIGHPPVPDRCIFAPTVNVWSAVTLASQRRLRSTAASGIAHCDAGLAESAAPVADPIEQLGR
jgi:NAD(P)-dependent dehydrogenase (short-subunit alcohol dehydrogenase family)